MLLIGWECDVDLVEMRREREAAVTRGAGLGSDTAIHGMTLTKSASTSGGVQVFGRLGAALLLTSIILRSGAPAAQEKCASLLRPIFNREPEGPAGDFLPGIPPPGGGWS